MTATLLAAVQRPLVQEIEAIAPVIAVVLAIVATLLVPLISAKRSAVIGAAVAVFGLLLAFSFSLFTPQRDVFGGLIRIDPAAIFWQRIVTLFVAGVVLMDAGRRRARAADSPEFFVLLLSAATGMMLMASTTHLLTMLLAMEIASMPSYVLAGFRKGQRRSAEASLKFALFGAVCTAVMIYGISLLFGAHRTFDVVQIAAGPMSPMAAVGWLFVFVSILFKVGGVPLHFWLPDAFDGAETPVAAFLSVASKGAGVMLLARFATMLGQQSDTGRAIAVLLAVIAVATTTFGNLAAWRQSDVKRLLAYSSIAHAGYLLSALSLPGPTGVAATLIYLAIYSVMNLGAFSVVADVEADTGSTAAPSFEGLSTRSPLAAAAMAICLFSMVGLPPAAGFLAKWRILAALTSGGGAWWIVAASVAINSIVSLAVYARVLRPMYLSPAKDERALPVTAGVLGLTCAIALIAMLVFFAPLDRWASFIAATGF